MAGQDPRNNLPVGRSLTRETHDALMTLWASVDYRTLTPLEIQSVVGAPIGEVPTIRRVFETGEHPPVGRPR